jgi:cobalamin biosynthesis protein CobT
LWQIEDSLLKPTPQWHFRPQKKDSGSGQLGVNKPKVPLNITFGEETDEDMPGLQEVSDTSDEEEYTNSDDDTNSESGDGESDSDEYDTDQEDEIRDMLREAMDTAAATDWFDEAGADKDLDPFTDSDRKNNPFLKLLQSLRGRIFSSSPKFRSTKTDAKIDPSKLPKPGTYFRLDTGASH